MALTHPEFLNFKTSCLVTTNFWLGVGKFALFLLIFNQLNHFFKTPDLVTIPVWLCITLLIDGFLVFKKPKFFEKIELSEEAQKKYKISSAAFREHLQFSPKIRIGFTLLLAVIVMIFCDSDGWFIIFFPTLFVISFLFNPILKIFFNISSPVFEHAPHEHKPSESVSETHEQDIGWAGSPAWTAYRSMRELNEYQSIRKFDE